MIRLKTLLNEKNTRSKYDLIMDVIGEFIELKDQVDSRMLKIEELLQRLKPELDDRTQLNPNDLDKEGDHLTRDEENDEEPVYRG